MLLHSLTGLLRQAEHACGCACCLRQVAGCPDRFPGLWWWKRQHGAGVPNGRSTMPKSAVIKTTKLSGATHAAKRQGRKRNTVRSNASETGAQSRRKPRGQRQGTKTSVIVGLLKRNAGATLQELMDASSWQAHSVRGFLSGTLKKKQGLPVSSAKDERGVRRYRILA